jgi:hypothetical protein
VEPAPKLERQDDRELRQKILALGGLEAERLGIRKNTLHLLRKKAANVHSFKLYRKTLLELEKVTVAR